MKEPVRFGHYVRITVTADSGKVGYYYGWLDQAFEGCCFFFSMTVFTKDGVTSPPQMCKWWMSHVTDIEEWPEHADQRHVDE